MDSSGQPLSLATQQAADILATGDPMWCNGADLPNPTTCTSSFNVFSTNGADTGLLDYLAANSATYNGPGTIYVAATYDSSLEPGDVTIDGGTLSALTNLIVQGGWDFVLNTISGGNSQFNGNSLAVTNWFNGNVAINNVDVQNSNDGLYVNTAGDVALNNVNVDATTNNNGITIVANGNVALTSVDSSNNSGTGATVNTDSNITVNNSQFNDNGTKAPIDSGTEGDSYYYENASGSSGLQASADGNVSLTDVSAGGNGLDGANLSGYDVSVTDSQLSGNGYTGSYSYTSSDDLSNTVTHELFQAGNGLTISADNLATLSGVTANDNAGNGTDISHSNSLSVTSSDFSGNGYGASFSPYTSLPVLGPIDQAADYAYNETQSDTTNADTIDAHVYAGNGLSTNSLGSSSLVDVTAIGNAGSGANLYSQSGDLNLISGLFTGNGYGLFNDFSSLMLAFSFNISPDTSNNSDFSWNFSSGSGLYANSHTAVVNLLNMAATDNAGSGAEAYASNGTLNVSNSLFEGNGYVGTIYGDIKTSYDFPTDFESDSIYQYDNGLSGLVGSAGSVNLLNVVASDNAFNGAAATANPGNIQVTGGNLAGNGSMGQTYSSEDHTYDYGTDTGSTTTSESTTHGSGLYASSNHGSITLNGVSTTENTANGADLVALNDVTVLCSTLDNNGDYGARTDAATTKLVSTELVGNGVGPYNVFAGVPSVSTTDCNPAPGNPSLPDLNAPGAGGTGPASSIPGKPTLPIQHAPGTGGTSQEGILNCESYSGTLFTMPDKDRVLFYCDTVGNGFVHHYDSADKLPGDLPQGDTFVSGMDANVVLNDQSLTLLPAPTTVAFKLTDELKNATLAILYWDSTANSGAGDWVEMPQRAFVSPGVDMIYSLHTPTDGNLILEGMHQTSEGYYQVNVNFTGTFILVKK